MNWHSPFLPTMHEAGYDVHAEAWLGTFLPAKTPQAIVDALNAAIGAAVRSPEMKESLAKIGNEPTFDTPANFAATVKADLETWGPVVKASGFVAED